MSSKDDAELPTIPRGILLALIFCIGFFSLHIVMDSLLPIGHVSSSGQIEGGASERVDVENGEDSFILSLPVCLPDETSPILMDCLDSNSPPLTTIAPLLPPPDL